MRLKINILLVSLCCYVLSNTSMSFAQQLPQYTQWSSHQFAINPAHAGIKNCLDVHSLFRAQWLGFEGAPKSGFLTIAAPINGVRKHAYSPRHGIGAKIETDKIGVKLGSCGIILETVKNKNKNKNELKLLLYNIFFLNILKFL